LAIDNLHEKELLQRISKDDEKAFREVFDLYKGRFFAAALKMTRSPDEAEEIVQEVFVSLWMRRALLATVENPPSYLFTIVYNAISARFKKMALEMRMKQMIAERVVESENIIEEKLEEKEANERIQSILHRLPEQQQLVYYLSKEEGLSREEIAHRMHISPNTVKNHLLRATKYIREHFNKVMIIILLISFTC
jgi:RNA polymerase sigma-70 factor (ECF subfamily)